MVARLKRAKAAASFTARPRPEGLGADDGRPHERVKGESHKVEVYEEAIGLALGRVGVPARLRADAVAEATRPESDGSDALLQARIKRERERAALQFANDRDLGRLEATMARLDAEAEAAAQRPSRVPTAAEARAYLESLPGPWSKTSDAGRKTIAEAVFERIDVLDEEGRVDRPVDLGGWWTRGQATAKDGLIDFATDVIAGSPTDGRSQFVSSRDRLLEDFSAPATATDDGPATFAGRWGPLGLCWHGLPRDHPSEDGGARSPRRGECFDPFAPDPVEFWRYWAARASSIAAVAAALKEGSVGPLRAWLTLSSGVPWVRQTIRRSGDGVASPRAEPGPDLAGQAHLELDLAFLGFDPALAASPSSPRPSREEEHLAFARSELARVVDAWLLLGAVRTTLSWNAERPALTQRSTGLFGAIGVQLMLAIAGRGLATCANCGQGFVPSRRPNLNRRSWCSRPGCRKASHATAERDRRARRRGPQDGPPH